MRINLGKQEFTILAVDDTDIFLDIIEAAVSHLGNFIRAENGEIGLIKAREYRPDIILLDIEMPDINGLEVAKQLKSNPITSASTIIFITAHNEVGNELQAFLEGGVDFIPKPINQELIRARVRTHLSLINKTRQLRKAHSELANIVARLNIFISYWTYDLINIYSNDVDGNWFNKSANEMSGQTLLSLFSKSEGIQFDEEISKCINEKTNTFKFSFVNFQEQRKNIQVTLINNRSFDSEPGYLIIMKEAEQAPESDNWEFEKKKLTTSLDVVGDGVITTDADGHITYANSAATRLTGLSEEDMFSKAVDSVMNIVDKNTNESIVNPVNYALTEHCRVCSPPDSVLISESGQRYEVEDTASPIFDEKKRLIGSVLVFKDVTKTNEHKRKIIHLNNHDALTNLPNRTLLLDRAEQAIKEAKRDSNKIAVLMINIDRFQQVNESYGFNIGDKVLRETANILSSLLRDYDTLSRQGGDEFVVVLPMICNLKNISEFCFRMKSQFNRLWKSNDFDFNLTLSIGVSTYPDDFDDVYQLFQRAHTAMHEAKKAGRDTIRFFSKEIEAQIKLQQEQLLQLKAAIEQEEIGLFYQPKVKSDSLEIIGFEALARWPQKDGSFIFPDHFIPLAEETGLIVPLGETLLRKACSQLVEWQKTYPNLHVSVNVSAVQFTPQLVVAIQETLKITGLSPNSLELEITESVLLNDSKSLVTFNKLKALGIRISIDDFGTGYSSLSYIKKYALDVLKIDQAFVKNMLNDNTDITIIRTIITLAKNLEIDLVAEGVETREHANRLRNLGCNLLQGYYFGRPISAEETSKQLAISNFVSIE